MKKKLKYGATIAVAFSPLLALAAGTNIGGVIQQIQGIINYVIPFLVGISVLILIWGVFNYIAGAGDEEKRAQAKQFIIWGIIGIFIMLSVWGLVNVLVSSFTLDKGRPIAPDVPCVMSNGTPGTTKYTPPTATEPAKYECIARVN